MSWSGRMSPIPQPPPSRPVGINTAPLKAVFIILCGWVVLVTIVQCCGVDLLPAIGLALLLW